MTVRDAACGLDHVTRINPRPDLRFYNLSLHQDAEADEVGYFRTVSKGSLLEWVDRMSTTPATFGERTVGTWINAVMARGDLLPLESRLRLSFKRFGLSCGEPLKRGEFDEYEPRAGCPETRTPSGTRPSEPPRRRLLGAERSRRRRCGGHGAAGVGRQQWRDPRHLHARTISEPTCEALHTPDGGK